MAMRKKGNIYYAYYSFLGRYVSRSLGTSDFTKAQAMDAAFKEALDAQRRALRMNRLSQGVDLAALNIPATPAADAPIIPHSRTSSRGATLNTLYAIAAKRRKLSNDHRKSWDAFCASIGCYHASDVTPQMAQDYMDARYGTCSPKRYNNVLSSLKLIFRLSLVEAGLSRSPLENLQPKRQEAVEHFRAFTDDEIALILKKLSTLSEGWMTASMISMYTGLRLESCRRLTPSHIENGVITILPGKTARFGRAVKIPLLPQLRAYLDAHTPPSSDTPYIAHLPRDWKNENLTWFSGFLKSLDIRDTPEGKASFHSWRVTFVSRASAAGISDTVLRGVVGHTTQEMTDLYNHDTSAAIREFSSVKIY